MRHIDFSDTTFEFYDQPQKIIPLSSKTNRVSWLNSRYRENVFGSFGELCLNDVRKFSSNQKLVLNLAKLIGLLSFTSTNPVSISSTGTDISCSENELLQWSCGAENFS